MLLIGSRAMNYHFPDSRLAKDWDFIITTKELTSWVKDHLTNIAFQKLRSDKRKLFIKLKTGEKIEFEICKPHSSSEMLLSKDYEKSSNKNIGDYSVVCPNTLLMLKLSHIHHPIHWQKTIQDYHYLKSKCNNFINNDIGIIRKKEISDRIKSKVNLNMSNDDFFSKSAGVVGRFYEHDDLHRVTCYYDNPLFERLKHDKTKAKLDKDLWDGLEYTDQLKTVREECYAIALERVVIPVIEKGKIKSINLEKEAFDFALQRICTTLTKGWFRDFAIENYFIIREYGRCYIELFEQAVQTKKIKRIKDEREG